MQVLTFRCVLALPQIVKKAHKARKNLFIHPDFFQPAPLT
jgi:glycerol-3-phosphate responsive antiterminator